MHHPLRRVFGLHHQYRTYPLTLNISFSYLAARSVTEQNSGWQPQGVSTLPETTPTFPHANVLSPTTGDATNATNIQTTWLFITSAVNADRACYVAYFRPGNVLLLFPDNGDGNLATAMPLSGQGSSVTIAGNALTFNLNTVFKPAFVGPRILPLSDHPRLRILNHRCARCRS